MAYVAAVSLLQILDIADQFSNIPYPDSEIKHLRYKVSFLKFVLENTSSLTYRQKDIDDLERQIRYVIYKVEDIIESHMSAHFLSSESASSREDNYISIFCQCLQTEKIYIDSIEEMTNRLIQFGNLAWFSLHIDSIERMTNQLVQFGNDGFGSLGDRRNDLAPRHALPRQDIIVGREEASLQLKDLLTKRSDMLTERSDMLEVVPVVGIPGIGKTVLAQLVYNDLCIRNYFTTRAWVKVSQEYSKRDILLGLLRSMKKLGGENLQQTDDQLAKYLYNSLRHKRYLVVLDDIRDVEAWNDLKELFPDYNNGSKVMLTTRKIDVARFASNSGLLYYVPLLSDSETWALLRKIVFGDKEFPPKQECPPKLETLAKKIVNNCSGLPLVIVTLGSFLAGASITEWDIAAYETGNCKNLGELTDQVVSLCYKNLPQYSKACLLYMAIFPDNDEIPVSKLIKLWIAEGFIEKVWSVTLEEMAEQGLLLLVYRRLVSVCEWSSNGKIKTCRIHESFRDFFMRKAKEERFFHVINKDTEGFLEEEDYQRRLCILKNIRFGIKDVAKYNSKAWVSKVRSLLYRGPQHQYPLRAWLEFKLLKVVDALNIRFYRFPPEILKLVHLRYLAFSYNGVLPASICKLWNLQFLNVLQYLSTKYSGAPLHLPMEIWNMKELRHLQITGRDLPDPSAAVGESDDGKDTRPVLKYLLTLSDVSSRSCTPRVLQRIPSLKKLGIRIESLVHDDENHFSFLSNLCILHRLQSLKCAVMHPHFGSQMVSSVPVFPPTLRKLSLSGCGFSWKFMSYIGTLPKLEVLKLRCYAFQGPVWESNEGEFNQLKFLLLEDLDIEQWIADSVRFPLLTHLIIRHCYKLREIPSGIGEIPTLQTLELDDCSPFLVISAQQIKEEQRSYGNDWIQVPIHSSSDD